MVSICRRCIEPSCEYPAVVYPEKDEIHPYYCAKHMMKTCTCEERGSYTSMCNECKFAFRYNREIDNSADGNQGAYRRKSYVMMVCDYFDDPAKLGLFRRLVPAKDKKAEKIDDENDSTKKDKTGLLPDAGFSGHKRSRPSEAAQQEESNKRIRAFRLKRIDEMYAQYVKHMQMLQKDVKDIGDFAKSIA